MLLAVAGTLGMSALLTSFGVAATPTGILGEHYIQPAHASNKCITVHGWDRSNGAKIDLWTCNGQQNQRWSFMDDGNFRDWIKSAFSNKCLDGGDLKKGRKVIQWPCHTGLNQAWAVIAGKGNTFSIHVGTSCLDVEGGNTANGARLILWSCNDRPNQRFRLR